jgi:hypothetical protein
MATARGGIQELKIGPYAGGINRYSDESAIADNEMVDCVNFDIDLDGSLKSRPPWRVLYETGGLGTAGTHLIPLFQLIVGTYTYNSVQTIFYTEEKGNGSGGFTWNLYVYFVNGPSAGTSSLVFAGNYSKSVRYGNIVYFIPDPKNATDNGVSYHLDNSVGPASVPLKRGYAAVIYKDRLWITGRRGLAPESRLYFSDPGNPISFPGTNFFDINPGDGDACQDITVYQDNLLIFKDSATYVLTFDASPAQADLQVVNTDVGVNGPRCVIPYENSIFILQYNAVYEMVNYDFTRVSVKVPFEYDVTLPDVTNGWSWRDPIWLSRIGDRLVVRFYNRLYIYHLRLRAWSRWDSNDIAIRYIGYIMLLDNTDITLRLGFNSYVATSSLNSQFDLSNVGATTWGQYDKIFILDDRYEGTFTENGNVTPVPSDISCTMKTKAFDFGFSHRFKRLVHWGVDLITNRNITGTAMPILITYRATWDQISLYQWHQLGTWQFPLFDHLANTVTQPSGTIFGRRFIRFPKSFRFRLVQFEVDLVTAGNTSDGPARLYSITAFVVGKQLVPQAVN